jgi:hypothetical protein
VREVERHWTRLSDLSDDTLLDLEAHALEVRRRAFIAMFEKPDDVLPEMFGALDVRCRLLSAEIARRCSGELDALF